MAFTTDIIEAEINTRFDGVDSTTKPIDFVMLTKAATELKALSGAGVTADEVIVPPSVVSPIGEAISLQPTLTTSAFSAGAGVTHDRTRYQVSTQANFSGGIEYDVISTDLVSHIIPLESQLAKNTQYYWRAAFISLNGTISDWGSSVGFITGDALSNVFSTTLYTGNAPSTQFIETGINLRDRDGFFIGGNVSTNDATSYTLGLFNTFDGENLKFNMHTATSTTAIDYINSFDSSGLLLGISPYFNQYDSVLWTFLKQRGFFDIVRYVGDATVRTIPHELGTEAGMVWYRSNSNNRDMMAWHRHLGSTKAAYMQSNSIPTTNAAYFNNTNPSPTELTLGNHSDVNYTNDQYTAYVFAHNPDKGIFCGSYSGTNGAGNKQTLGADFPVGWLLIRDIISAGNWYIFDNKRNPTNPVNIGKPLNSASGQSSYGNFNFLADGFEMNSGSLNVAGRTYIFMAIADPDTFTG